MSLIMDPVEFEGILQSFNLLSSGWERMQSGWQRFLDSDLVEGLTPKQLVQGVAKLKIALMGASDRSSAGIGGEDKEAVGTLLEALVMHMERRPTFCMTSACTAALEIVIFRCLFP